MGNDELDAGGFLAQLRALDIAVSAAGDRLRINAPKGALTDDLRAAIIARKNALLATLRGGASTAAPPIPRRGVNEAAPLSLAQERLWLLAHLQPESSVYNLCRAMRLRGLIDRQALAASLNEIVRRHVVLRSKLRIIGGRAMQVPLAGAGRTLLVTDLRRLPPARRDAELRRRIMLEAQKAFRFGGGAAAARALAAA
jgi:hypothetical protein